MLHFFSSLWVLRRYNSSLWGKLYSEWRLTPHRQEQCAVILHCFHLADSLTSLWGLGQTGETSEAKVSPARHTTQRSASCSTAFCHHPMSLCCQHHPITRSRVACAAVSKQRRHRQGCTWAGLTLLPGPSWGQLLPAEEKSPRTQSRNLGCTGNLYCSVAMKKK